MRKKTVSLIMVLALTVGLFISAPIPSFAAESNEEFYKKEIAVAVEGSVSYKFVDSESISFIYDKTADIGDNVRGSTKYEIRKSADVYILTITGVRKGVSVAKVVDNKKSGKKQTIQLFMQVTSPTVKELEPVMTIGEKYKPKVSGTCECSTVLISSTNANVISVTQNEKGKTVLVPKSVGTAQLSITVDGLKFVQTVTCEEDLSMNEMAVREAEKVLGATYSQERRMQKGFYDCSSLVWRCYKEAGSKLTEGDTAPVAADIAKILEKRGRAIAYGYMQPDMMKPGDLIFYASNDNNGRYKNISHVAMYYGPYTDAKTGKTTEKIIHAYSSVQLGDYKIFGVSKIVMIVRP